MKLSTEKITPILVLLITMIAPSAVMSASADDLRYRSGTVSILSGHQMIVRLTELERAAGDSRVRATFRDGKGRLIRTVSGLVSAAKPFEAVLDADEIGSGQRQLVAVEVLLVDLPQDSVPVVQVEFYDPFDFAIEERWICNGRNASGGGPIGNCQGIVDFVVEE